MLKTLALLLALTAPASAGSYFSNSLNTTTGRQEMKISGSLCLAASSNTPNTCSILLNGTDGQITAPSMNFGHDIEDEGIDIVERTTMNFVGGGVVVADSGGKTVITIPGVTDEVLRSTAASLGQLSTSASAWETISGSTLALVMSSAQYVAANFSCNLECVDYTQCGTSFGLLVDGAHTSGQTAALTSGIMYVETNASTTGSPMPINIRFKTRNKLTAGTHNLALVWASSGAVPVQIGRNMGGCTLEYAEAPELFNSSTGITLVNGPGPGITGLGALSQATLQATACSVLPCQAQGTFDMYDIWVATGTGAGQWLNTRTGLGP
jgi:hypothetical protein